MMYKQTLEFFSGFPILLGPNTPAKLKKAKLDGRKRDIYKDRRGNEVQVSRLTADYHVYVLASRRSSFFGREAVWDSESLTVKTSLIFNTYPNQTEVPVEICLDGSSPYEIPYNLKPSEVESVNTESPEIGGLPMTMVFTHKDGSRQGFMLAPDLQHFMKYPLEHKELTDFHVEYVGIACGKNGDSNVFKRARAHEKVVEIQGDLQQSHGNKDLFIFAYDPGYIIHTTVPGAMAMTGPNLIDIMVHGGQNSLFEAMEASLISYFQPEYNVEYKNFPTRRPIWLQGRIDSFDGMVLNVGNILVTLASDSTYNPEGQWSFGGLWSNKIHTRHLHYIDIDVT